jgi:hypothetical protein
MQLHIQVQVLQWQSNERYGAIGLILADDVESN